VTWDGGTKDTVGNVTLRSYVQENGGQDYSRDDAGKAAALQAIENAVANGDNTVTILGYSRGGVAANDLAKMLKKAGIVVTKLIIIDPVNLTMLIPSPAHLDIPSNVISTDNYYQTSGGPFNGGAAQPGPNVTNHDESAPGINHNTIVCKVLGGLH